MIVNRGGDKAPAVFIRWRAPLFDKRKWVSCFLKSSPVVGGKIRLV